MRFPGGIGQAGTVSELGDEREREAARVCNAAAEWAGEDPSIRAVGLAGSYARGGARADSDVDLVVLADDPRRLLEGDEWHDRFGDVELVRREQFGLLVERRLRLPSGLEIEVGIVPISWAATDPVDPGTHRVVREGFRILFERDRLLTVLVRCVKATSAL
jgi:predicted nucleotidyltransferase